MVILGKWFSKSTFCANDELKKIHIIHAVIERDKQSTKYKGSNTGWELLWSEAGSYVEGDNITHSLQENSCSGLRNKNSNFQLDRVPAWLESKCKWEPD